MDTHSFTSALEQNLRKGSLCHDQEEQARWLRKYDPALYPKTTS